MAPRTKKAADTPVNSKSDTSDLPSYAPDKIYHVTLARVVEHDGFTFKPGFTTTAMAGDLLNAIVVEYGAGAIAEATELPPEPDQPAVQAAVHEVAEQ